MRAETVCVADDFYSAKRGASRRYRYDESMFRVNTILLVTVLVVQLFPILVVAQRRMPADAEVVGTAVRRLRVGLDANPKASSDYRREAWAESIRLMRTTGATQFHYSQQWSAIERQPGSFDTNEAAFIVEQADRMRVIFTFKVIDAGQRTMPDAYRALPWDSPEMINAIVRATEALASALGPRVWSYSVGNEIDMYFSSRPGEIAPYARMLQQVKARVRQLHPDASFTTTFQFASAPHLRNRYRAIVDALDHVAFTYYPLAANFTVRPPEVFDSDLQIMLMAAAPRPITLQEIGYPTAARLGSSPELQARFVRQAFEAVRAVGTSHVLGVTYLFQADLPEWLVNDLVAAYGVDDPNFRAFLSTLGLRDERDRPKPGWDEFVRQAEISGPPQRER